MTWYLPYSCHKSLIRMLPPDQRLVKNKKDRGAGLQWVLHPGAIHMAISLNIQRKQNTSCKLKYLEKTKYNICKVYNTYNTFAILTIFAIFAQGRPGEGDGKQADGVHGSRTCVHSYTSGKLSPLLIIAIIAPHYLF